MIKYVNLLIMKLKIDIDGLLQDAEEAIGPKKVRNAIRNAVNATASELKKNTVGKATAKFWNITEGAVKKDSSVTRVGRDGLEASMQVKSPPATTINYTVAPNPKKHWATMKERPNHKVMTIVKKLQGATQVPANAVSEPFLATVSSGGKSHTGVFVRIEEMNRKPVDRSKWKWTPWKDTPIEKLQKIKELYTIPAAGMARGKDVQGEVWGEIDEVFAKALQKKLDDQYKKVKK